MNAVMMPKIHDNLIVCDDSFKGNFTLLTGKSEYFYIAFIPSLNISGYGESEKEAEESLHVSLDAFKNDWEEWSDIQRDAELKKLGWKIVSDEVFECAYVDCAGNLRNFIPETEDIISKELAL
ncbi:MAG: hypothetical protein KDC16_10805 [Saprospiraceae bacterium]|nr:hypothetical protein [Saprospiraceae bacterium]